MLKRIIKPLCVVLIAYLVFAVVGSTLPYLLTKRISDDNRRDIEQTQYRGSGIGPDRVGLIEDPVSAMGVRLSLVRAATTTLDVTYHVLRSGDCTEAFLGELLLAADRGVEVRVLVDGKTEVFGHGDLRAITSHPNISCREYNPVNLLTPWRWHAFLHDKFIITDGELLLLGGRNIDDRYFEPRGYSLDTTHDRDVLVWKASDSAAESISAVEQVADYMNLLWEYEHSGDMRPPRASRAESRIDALYSAAADFEASNEKYYLCDIGYYKEQTVPTRKITLLSNPIETNKKEPLVAYALKHLSEQAASSVTIQSPYATGNKHLLTALSNASNNADVRLITNSALSSPNMPAFSNYLFQREKFLATGISIYEYQKSDSIHGKSLIFDSRLSAVGSFNLDDRSIYIDTETMLVIDSEEFAEILAGAIEDIRSECLEVGADNKYVTTPEAAAPKAKRILLGVVYILLKPFQRLL